MQVSWENIKSFCSTRNLSMQYLDLGDSYELRAFDGLFSLECNIPRTDTSDITEFETEYKPNGNKKLEQRSAEGYSVIAPTFEDAQGLTTVWKGYIYVAQPNSLNIFDEVVTTQLKLRGGWYKLLDNNANLGDYMEFAIIDKDDVLGLFAYFNLTVGVDVLELKKFVRTEYISPNIKERQDFQSGGASEIMAGLYFRTYYYNCGSTAVNFTITEKYHEA